MQSTKQRRFPLARIFGGFTPKTASRRVRVKSPFTTGNLMLDDLESRVLLAGNPTQLFFNVQPSPTAAGTPMFPAVRVAVADSSGATVTTDSSKVTLIIFSGPSTTFSNNATFASVNAVNGIANFTNLTFTAVGTYTLLATDGTLNNVTSNSFTVGSAAAKLVFTVPPSNMNAGTVFSPTVQVQDSNGAIVSTDRSTVTLTVSSGPGAIVGTTVGVISNGSVTFSGLSLPKAGTYRLSVTDGSLTGATTSPFVVSPGAASALTFEVAPTSTAVNSTITPALKVDIVDALGNIITTDNSSITLAIGQGVPSGVTLLGTTTIAAVNGVATFSDLSIGTPGAFVLQASDGSLTGNSSSFNVTGPATQVAFLRQPTQTTAGGIITPSVQVAVEDAAGHVVVGDSSSVTISIGSGPGSLGGTATVQAVNGIATFTNLSLSQMGTYTLAAADGLLTGASSSNFLINGTATQLAFFTQPVNSAAGVPLSGIVRVEIEDSAGNLVIDGSSLVTIALVGTGGTLAGTTQVAAVNGIASFNNLIISAAGTFQLSASDGLLTGATSNSFAVSPAATSLTFVTPPSDVAAKSVMYPAVVVDILDSNSAPVSTNTSQVTLVLVGGPAGATMGGTTTVSAVAGVATFDNLTFSKSGTYTLLAYDGNLVTETTVDFVVGPAATHLAFTSPFPATVMAGDVLNFSVKVTDGSAKTVTTDHSQVVLTITGPTGATIGGTTTVTTINGVATFSDIVLTVAGKYQFKVTDGSLTGASSNSFTVTPDLNVILDSSSTHVLSPQFLISQSSTSSTLVGRTLTQSIVVAVADIYHNIFTTVNSGHAVLSILSGPNATISGTTTANFINGVATFNNISLNLAGTYTLLTTESGVNVPGLTPNVNPGHGTASYTTVISPVINFERAPNHNANYAVGATINLNTQISSVVAAPASIKYLNGTSSETARLVDIAGNTLETGTVSATGAVKFTFNDLPMGSYDVYVIYDGDANHTGARSPQFHFNVGNTTTNLKVSHLVINSGGTLTLTATANNAVNNQLIASGNIQLFEDGNLITTGAISTASGHTAVFSIVMATTGQHSFTASFVANSSLNSSTSPIKLITVF